MSNKKNSQSKKERKSPSNDNQYIFFLRHSAEHVLTMAILRLWPEVKMAMGPATEDGFYFDFDFDGEISTEDFASIEKEMKKIIKENLEFKREEISIEEARKLFKGNEYKQEWLDEIEQKGEKATIYRTGDEFVDLCSGPHVEKTGEIKAFKLLSIAGAYWRGDEKNKMLTRIYGTAFSSKEELKEYSILLKEAKKRDHKKLGKQLGLFVFSELVGPGMPLYTPKGAIVRNEISNYSRNLNSKIGFDEVYTPNANKAELFKKSGHYEKFKDDMLEVKSHYTGEEYFLKPMNCPQHTQIYASDARSYKDLPIRFSDFANLYRDEKPGELSGLTRLRCFTQDDGHSFCRKDQIKDEFNNVLGVIREALTTYGLDYSVRLSLRDPNAKEKYIGDDDTWNEAEEILEKLLKESDTKYERVEGEAAFYGPKMDIMAHDCLKRTWQISTIQLDLSMPARFGLEYTDSDGSKKTPVMIHRALVGSPERFMGILIEHYAGAFPLWLAPIQVQIVPVGEAHIDHSNNLKQEFIQQGIRVEVDSANETVGNKIRKATKAKVPYMLVIGDKEISSPNLHIRQRGKEDLSEMTKEDFVSKIQKEIQEKTIW